MHQPFLISVPASSANIGPGFDVLGLALNLFLQVNVYIDTSKPAPSESTDENCTLSYEGEGANTVPLLATHNLITRVALYVLRVNGLNSFPLGTHVHVNNPIPLGRGLGSSGAAVVAGVLLANELGGLSLSKQRMLDYCLMIERHPDNITAAMVGGFVGSYLRELSETDMSRVEIPLAEVLPEPAGGINTGLVPPEPPLNIGHHIKYDWCKDIKAVCIVPNFEVSTAKSREVLPSAYTKKDLIFNLQRLAVLTTALTKSPPDSQLIYAAMQDHIHQPYRKVLIPGLSEILKSMTPKTHKGLLGICLSGAGPTILALATENFENIAKEIVYQFEKEKINCVWHLLEPAYDGATVSYV